MLKVLAPAKVNLFLGVGSVRPDGYHAVSTVLHALELHDVLEIEPAQELSFTCEPAVTGAPELNLAHRAAVAMAHAFGRDPAVLIRLRKRIPHGGGLGGGSSDAAAVVAALAHLWGVSLVDERCLSVAVGLGSDVPFFLVPGGAALMGGRGEVAERVLSPMRGLPVALVGPRASVSTSRAYQAFDESPMPPGSPDAVIRALDAPDVSGLAAAMRNNLEAAAMSVTPEVGQVLEWMRTRSGVSNALIAGSGSTVFALCRSDEVARGITESAAGFGWWSAATRLGAHGVRLKPEEEVR